MEAEIDKQRYQESTIVGMEALRQLPLPVFNFDIRGNLIYRNPEAVKIYALRQDKQQQEGELDEEGGKETKATEEEPTKDMVALFVQKEMGKKILKEVATEGTDNSLRIYFEAYCD